MASQLPSTPRKLSFKTIENLHTICICCCQNNGREKGRRIANAFKDLLIKLDSDYKYVFQSGSPVNLFICKYCVNRLNKISSSTSKMEELKREFDTQTATFGELAKVFKAEFMQWKRTSVQSPFKANKQARSHVLQSNSPSKIPLPTHPIRQVPSSPSKGNSSQRITARQLFTHVRKSQRGYSKFLTNFKFHFFI
jgi:predicted AAA+ superfamily ATPase